MDFIQQLKAQGVSDDTITRIRKVSEHLLKVPTLRNKDAHWLIGEVTGLDPFVAELIVGVANDPSATPNADVAAILQAITGEDTITFDRAMDLVTANPKAASTWLQDEGYKVVAFQDGKPHAALTEGLKTVSEDQLQKHVEDGIVTADGVHISFKWTWELHKEDGVWCSPCDSTPLTVTGDIAVDADGIDFGPLIGDHTKMAALAWALGTNKVSATSDEALRALIQRFAKDDEPQLAAFNRLRDPAKARWRAHVLREAQPAPRERASSAVAPPSPNTATKYVVAGGQVGAMGDGAVAVGQRYIMLGEEEIYIGRVGATHVAHPAFYGSKDGDFRRVLKQTIAYLANNNRRLLDCVAAKADLNTSSIDWKRPFNDIVHQLQPQLHARNIPYFLHILTTEVRIAPIRVRPLLARRTDAYVPEPPQALIEKVMYVMVRTPLGAYELQQLNEALGTTHEFLQIDALMRRAVQCCMLPALMYALTQLQDRSGQSALGAQDRMLLSNALGLS